MSFISCWFFFLTKSIPVYPSCTWVNSLPPQVLEWSLFLFLFLSGEKNPAFSLSLYVFYKKHSSAQKSQTKLKICKKKKKRKMRERIFFSSADFRCCHSKTESDMTGRKEEEGEEEEEKQERASVWRGCHPELLAPIINKALKSLEKKT